MLGKLFDKSHRWLLILCIAWSTVSFVMGGVLSKADPLPTLPALPDKQVVMDGKAVAPVKIIDGKAYAPVVDLADAMGFTVVAGTNEIIIAKIQPKVDPVLDVITGMRDLTIAGRSAIPLGKFTEKLADLRIKFSRITDDPNRNKAQCDELRAIFEKFDYAVGDLKISSRIGLPSSNAYGYAMLGPERMICDFNEKWYPKPAAETGGK